ncbi:DUF4041 domain-containing protein [Mumia flava]|uniref:DUF4041 domain-containing protein n=1 Tax=Mumia flava TaxID=1348852 RepID=UPI001B800A7B|nr:DUF4041 domain-containing protein [Mumia flava]
MPEGWQLWLPEQETAPTVPDPEPADHDAHSSDPGTAQVPTQATEPVPLVEPTIPNPSQQAPATGAAATQSPLRSRAPAADSSTLLRRIADLEAALAQSGGSEVVELADQRVLQDVGIYRYHHPLEDAAAYKDRLTDINNGIDALVRANEAILAAELFTFDGSLAKGRKMIGDLSKLMLRAYNAEADNCVRSLRNGNISTAKQRLEKAMKSIEKLGVIMEMRINPDYHQLRVEELELTADYQMKVQEEKEKAREERELLREQRKAEKELAAERERLEKEKSHYEGVLLQLRANGDDEAADELAARLTQIDEAIEANDYRTANIRAGYIYVISNIGALGPNIVKIGMTRRLEPRDRVRELGDASVPFLYDTHALFFSDDAVTLENELHKAFSDRRVNRVNERREFFFATPAEVRSLLMQKVGGLLEFNETPEAPEYYQSRNRWPTNN